MGCDLSLEDEHGARIAELHDPRNYVPCIVGLASESATICLRFIDPYGDTVFNSIQAPVFIDELVAARQLATETAIASVAQRQFGAAWQREAALRQLSASAVQGHIDQMLQLARRCVAEGALYLKFYGD